MDIPKKLYVDMQSADKSISVTTNNLSVSYNMYKMDRGNKQSVCFSAGKYIVVIMADEQHKPNLFFFDNRANSNAMEDFMATKELDSVFKQKLRSLIEAVNASYDRVANDVELIVGPSPAKPLS